MFEWNPVYNYVFKIKHEYEDKYGKIIDDDITNCEKNILETIIYKLNNKEYLNWLNTIKISSYKNFIEIHYNLIEAAEEMWKNDTSSINLEARGIVLDFLNEAIVNCPFRKFFNLDEVESTKFEVIQEKINNAKNIEITDKLDGSMQSASYYNDEVFVSGSQSCNPEDSFRVKISIDYFKEHKNYYNLVKENPEFTFIFEFINELDPHIVCYPKDAQGLYLIGIRNKYTGQELSYKEIMDFKNKYNVLATNIEKYTFDELLLVRDKFSSSEKEGWVISIDGFKVKFKCTDFLKVHRIFNINSLKKDIIHCIEDETIDDYLSIVPDGYKKEINEYISIVNKYVSDYLKELNSLYEKAPKDDRKTFALYVNKNVPKEYYSNIFNLYNGKKVYILKNFAGHYIETDKIFK